MLEGTARPSAAEQGPGLLLCEILLVVRAAAVQMRRSPAEAHFASDGTPVVRIPPSADVIVVDQTTGRTAAKLASANGTFTAVGPPVVLRDQETAAPSTGSTTATVPR